MFDISKAQSVPSAGCYIPETLTLPSVVYRQIYVWLIPSEIAIISDAVPWIGFEIIDKSRSL